MYEYRCKVIKVIDGDTVDVDIDLGFDIIIKGERVRIMGIDTPESRTRDKVEKKYGLKSKKFLQDQLKKAKSITIRTYKFNFEKVRSRGSYVFRRKEMSFSMIWFIYFFQ